MKQSILKQLIVLGVTAFLAFANTIQAQTSPQIECTELGCEGTYTGPEFVNGADIAHQFSNTMSARVGDKLKNLYKTANYYKVDFSKIFMSTKGMGSGRVVYRLRIPFVPVMKPCLAYTSFDHAGGWNHKPALAKRKKELSTVLMEGEKLAISALKTTSEGLQEYWIQWKNKIIQVSCRQPKNH